MSHPVARLTFAGLLLGCLGMLGGHLTLFKGLHEMKELTATAASYSGLALLMMGLIKVAALLVAGTSGFRGGRIFPAVFAGVALGLSVNSFFPSIPIALALTSAVLGILLAVTRSGWLSLFTAMVVVPDLKLLPVLCVVVLPAWLLVTGRPHMIIKSDEK